MTTITKKLNGLTIKELKELIKDIDEDTEISVCSEVAIQKCEVETITYESGVIDIYINIE